MKVQVVVSLHGDFVTLFNLHSIPAHGGFADGFPHLSFGRGAGVSFATIESFGVANLFVVDLDDYIYASV
jgi:hypothetical protein